MATGDADDENNSEDNTRKDLLEEVFLQTMTITFRFENYEQIRVQLVLKMEANSCSNRAISIQKTIPR